MTLAGTLPSSASRRADATTTTSGSPAARSGAATTRPRTTRITSYNVCYTKLLRWMGIDFIENYINTHIIANGKEFEEIYESISKNNALLKKINSNIDNFVITSYSIHYTKLYEFLQK